MQAKAQVTYVRISPRKVKIVLDLIRNKPVDVAAAILKYTPKAACEPVGKLLKSAIANAENNFNMDKNQLYVAEALVCPGPIMKRIRPLCSESAKETTVLPSRVQSFAFACNLSSVRIFFSCKRVSFPT